jgi:hypothetical protein
MALRPSWPEDLHVLLAVIPKREKIFLAPQGFRTI